MKKTLALLIAVLFAASSPALAGVITLSDAELDQVNAGDWVVIGDGQEVVDVHFNSNDIKLNDQSQMEIQAISNANAVDSAIAVQTNTASVVGEPSNNVAVNGYNEANVTNYNPSEEGSCFLLAAKKESLSVSSESDSSSSSSFDVSEFCEFENTLSETLTVDETLDIGSACAMAAESESKSSECELVSACALLVDYDYDLDYDKQKSKSGSHGCSLGTTSSSSSSSSCSLDAEAGEILVIGSEYRNNLSENNHIDLEDTSQQFIQAVSNLNAVGAAAAVQANIASNVGVTGTITHTNVATVVNGL